MTVVTPAPIDLPEDEDILFPPQDLPNCQAIEDYWSYDSKKETGYVGLKNQGATYMNSFLQSLFHIPYFRKAIYNIPTTENDLPSQSILLALQGVFYKLQYSHYSVATKELENSFGGDTYNSFMQHDVQELNRVFSDKLIHKMKGTVVEGTMQKLFEGHRMNYIECINVDYKSTTKESFYDLQLDVKGCRDVYASFDKYVEVERNKYDAEHNGLQDAKKGALFCDFPPVLQLQLKRYDCMRDSTGKINYRYEFPLQLDLDRENGKYLSPEANKSVCNLYTLHSVSVHSGGEHSGHCYISIRPTLSNQWYKFEDERVTEIDIKKVQEELYTGAYMLVYIRTSDKDEIFCSVDKKDIGAHLRANCELGYAPFLEKTKGSTNAVVFRKSDIFVAYDSRESYDCENLYIASENLNKLHLFPNQVFATMVGSPTSCREIWDYLDKEYMKKPFTVRRAAELAFEYNLTKDGECELLIGGFLQNGNPDIYHLVIEINKKSMKFEKKITRIETCNNPKERFYAIGSGEDHVSSLLVRDSVGSLGRMNVEEIKSKLSRALLQAAFKDRDTGGKLRIAHLKGPSRKRRGQGDGIERPAPSILENNTLEWYAVHFGSFLHNHRTIFVLYDKQQIGDAMLSDFFEDSLDDIGHVLAKVRGETLFVRRVLIVNDTKDLLARGKRDNDFFTVLASLAEPRLKEICAWWTSITCGRSHNGVSCKVASGRRFL